MTFSYQSFVVKAIILSGGSRGGARGPTPPYVSTKLRPERPKEIFLETGLPPYLRVGWGGGMTPPPPPYLKVWICH